MYFLFQFQNWSFMYPHVMPPQTLLNSERQTQIPIGTMLTFCWMGPDERWLCPKCGRNYKRKAHLSFHLAKECGVGPQYNCSKCFKFFKRSSHLKSHQLSCGDVSPKFQCDICKKKFTRKDNMKTHKNTIHRLSDPNIPNEVYAFYSEWQIGDSD
ncbi:zinc finger protein 134-like [Myzus persicae]|uniref:zinc finger protein 134-like n=1 Tax=Myzus persicae TaxID=13164 RepID=UPI000B930CD5|nr:zinc finger protein 134-like [Myzus persicae]